MTAPLLSIEGLRLEREGAAIGASPLVDGLSLALNPGEVVALVGESGSGKTLTARAIIRLLPRGVRHTAGRIRLDGEDLATRDARAMQAVRGGRIGYVFQDPTTSLNPAMKIGRQLEEGLRLHRRMAEAEIRQASLAMLKRVRIDDPKSCLDAYPHAFSGGMRQRIMLAAVILLRPSLIIADEPTTALDTLSQREVMDLMAALAKESGAAVLLITHDLGLVARYAERAVVLRKGQVVEEGATAQILRAGRHPYTRALVDALPVRAPARQPVEGPSLLSVRNLTVGYPPQGRSRGRMVLQEVDLDVRRGEMVAVVGGSGSGKSTLGRAVLGRLPIADGEIRFDGERVPGADAAARRRLRRDTQLVFQDPYASLDPRMRVRAIVDEPLRGRRGAASLERSRLVEEVLEAVDMAGFGERFPHQLSGGQRQRVAIARAVVARPCFVVADEPVSALDPTVATKVLALLRRMQLREGFACLFISHDLGIVEQVADRVIVLQEGRVVESGPRDAVFDHPQSGYTRELLAASPALGARNGLARGDGNVLLRLQRQDEGA